MGDPSHDAPACVAPASARVVPSTRRAAPTVQPHGRAGRERRMPRGGGAHAGCRARRPPCRPAARLQDQPRRTPSRGRAWAVARGVGRPMMARASATRPPRAGRASPPLTGAWGPTPTVVAVSAGVGGRRCGLPGGLSPSGARAERCGHIPIAWPRHTAAECTRTPTRGTRLSPRLRGRWVSGDRAWHGGSTGTPQDSLTRGSSRRGSPTSDNG